MKHTKGKCTIRRSGHSDFDLCVIAGDGGSVCHISNWPEKKSNAELIAEAFNVTNETGFTPRELADQKAELLEMLIKISNIEDHAFTLKGFDVRRLKTEIRKAIQKATP